MVNENRKFLLVDDDDDDLEVLTRAFESIDPTYEIVQAHNGAEALQKLKEMKHVEELPSLIVLDINMPKMDGKQTLVAIQEDQDLSSIPIVVLTTSSSMVDKMFFQKKNVEMLTKPVEFKTFCDIAYKLFSYVRER